MLTAKLYTINKINLLTFSIWIISFIWRILDYDYFCSCDISFLNSFHLTFSLVQWFLLTIKYLFVKSLVNLKNLSIIYVILSLLLIIIKSSKMLQIYKCYTFPSFHYKMAILWCCLCIWKSNRSFISCGVYRQQPTNQLCC